MKGAKKKILIFLLFVFLAIEVFAEEEKEVSNIKEVQGTVSWLGKDKIAIVYFSGQGSEEEILLPVSKDVKLEHIKSLDNLKVGDTVSILYEEKTEKVSEAEKTKLIIKSIRFIKPSMKK